MEYTVGVRRELMDRVGCRRCRAWVVAGCSSCRACYRVVIRACQPAGRV